MFAVLFQIRSGLVTRFRRAASDRGASLVEYALLLVFIMMVILISVIVIGDNTSEGLDDAGSSGFVEDPP